MPAIPGPCSPILRSFDSYICGMPILMRTVLAFGALTSDQASEVIRSKLSSCFPLLMALTVLLNVQLVPPKCGRFKAVTDLRIAVGVEAIKTAKPRQACAFLIVSQFLMQQMVWSTSWPSLTAVTAIHGRNHLVYGSTRTWQEVSAAMDDHQAPGSPAKPGLTDDELAIHPTVFAADALRDLVVVVSGGAGSGVRSRGCLHGSARMSPLLVATKANSTHLSAIWPAAT